jgi:hypothetical protein
MALCVPCQNILYFTLKQTLSPLMKRDDRFSKLHARRRALQHVVLIPGCSAEHDGGSSVNLMAAMSLL